MRFQSEWTGIESGEKIDPENGTHSPPWDELDESAQAVSEEAAAGAEGVISVLADKAHKKDDTKVLFTVIVSGYAPEGEDDSTRSAVSISIDETEETQTDA